MSEVGAVRLSGNPVFALEGEGGSVSLGACDISREAYLAASGLVDYVAEAKPPGGDPWNVRAAIGFMPPTLRYCEQELRAASEAATLQALTRRPNPSSVDLVRIDWDDPDFTVLLVGLGAEDATIKVVPTFWYPRDVHCGNPHSFELETTRRQLASAADQIDVFLASLTESLGFGEAL
jgi:hypothetical protein